MIIFRAGAVDRRALLHDQDGVSRRPGPVERRLRVGVDLGLVPGELGDVGRPRDVQVTPAARVPRVRHHRVHGFVQDDRLRGNALVRDARAAGERGRRGGELSADRARVVFVMAAGRGSRREALLRHRGAHRPASAPLPDVAAIGGVPRNGTPSPWTIGRVRPRAPPNALASAQPLSRSRSAPAPVPASTRRSTPGLAVARPPLTPRRDRHHRTCRTSRVVVRHLEKRKNARYGDAVFDFAPNPADRRKQRVAKNRILRWGLFFAFFGTKTKTEAAVSVSRSSSRLSSRAVDVELERPPLVLLLEPLRELARAHLRLPLLRLTQLCGGRTRGRGTTSQRRVAAERER